MAVARKIAFNVFAGSVSKILSTILALFAISIITRYLGKDGFGNYATVLAFLSLFSAVLDLGLNSISTREISREGADEKKIMSNIFTLRLFSSLLVIVLAPILLMFFDYSREVEVGIIIIGITYIFSSGYQVLNGVFQKNLSMDKVALSEFIGKVVQVAVVIWAVRAELGFVWIIGSLLFNMIVSFLLVLFWSRKYISLSFKIDIDYWKKFLKESLPMGGAVIITFLYFKMDTILLSVMKSSADVGIYNAAYKVIENITFFPAMIVGLILPIMSFNFFKNEKKFRDVSDKTFKFFAILVFPLIIAILFLAEPIIAIIGGADFYDSVSVLRILVFALAFIFFGTFLSAILIASNKQKKLMKVLIIAAVFNVSLNLILIPRYSYYASAFISVFTELIVVVLTWHIIQKDIRYNPQTPKGGAMIASGAAMAAFLFLLKDMSFIFLAPTSVLVYFLCLWALKAINKGEMLSLISKKGVEQYENIP